MNIKPQIKYKLILISFFTSFIAIAISLYFLKGIVADVKNSKTKVAEINRDISLLDKILLEKKQYANDIQIVKTTLPSQYYEVSYFTTQLERLAQNNNLALEVGIDKSKKEEKGSYSSITYALDIKGNYPSVSEFLKQMSKLPYHTSVNKIQILNGEEGLTTKVIFRLYVEK